MCELSTHDNPYLNFIFSGSYGDVLPPYLEPARYDALRGATERIVAFHGPVDRAGEVLGERFDGFNLSDIFEYCDPGVTTQLYGRLLDAANPGARLAYWNMLVARSCPEEFRDRVRSLDELSQSLWRRDRAWFYSAFVVEELCS